jgi:hypothetical protein
MSKHVREAVFTSGYLFDRHPVYLGEFLWLIFIQEQLYYFT